ncbi:hypothetical protein ABKN59_010304 [Abortiporus biennis]
MSSNSSSSTSPLPSSPRDFSEAPHPPSSTAPSSPPQVDLELEEHDNPSIVELEGEEEEEEDNMSEEDKKRWEQLGPFLEKVKVYARLLKEQMDKAKVSSGKLPAPTIATSHPATSNVQPSLPKFETEHKGVGGRKPKSSAAKGKGRKRARAVESDEEDENEHGNKRAKAEEVPPAPLSSEEEAALQRFDQPALITGAKLKDYQLEGVAWMAGLYQNGISGILADEMGLGKTLQTIAFHAYLRERSVAPFMVVCPLSVLYNWVEEFHKFAPQIPVCMYHGTPEERAELRRAQMVLPEGESQKYWLGTHPSSSSKKRGGRPQKKASGRTSKAKKASAGSDSEDASSSRNPVASKKATNSQSKEPENLPPHMKTTFPVVITTYEMIIKDRVHLANYRWGFIVVDEGHRLKNMDCKLMMEIKSLTAEGRMVLTGTPLHNNLAELWSLLNFVLPDVFTDLYTFQEWFNIPTKEYVLYAPLTERQREIYDAIVEGSLRALLLKERGGATKQEVSDGRKNGKGKGKGKAKEIEEDDAEIASRTRSHGGGKSKGKPGMYDVDGNDDEYFRRLETGDNVHLREKKELSEREKDTTADLGRAWYLKSQLKKINNMKLQNTVMQLRKVCSHPFLFDWPTDPISMQPVLNEELVVASGKMMVLERLLDELFRTGHKVLLFSQFTTMLDIIEDWATEFKNWPLCRIDGQTSMQDRRDEVQRFQKPDPKLPPDEVPNLFLLSTRAGGLGLNLVAADTVIFYDQDWNPQMDLQAQDRAHRIGQTKPVLIFRLVTAHTIESKIMQRANEKRKLEALVIAKGKFKSPTALLNNNSSTGDGKKTMTELAAELLKLEGEKTQVVKGDTPGEVINDEDLQVLLDRSPEVFVDRTKGWTRNTTTGRDGDEGGRKQNGREAFAVYEAPAHEGNDMLAGMMSEGVDE